MVAFVGGAQIVGRRRGGTSVCENDKSRRRSRVMANSWFSFHASQKVEAPIEDVYGEYANYSQMPDWAPWLQSVELEDEEKLISKWHIASKGFNFSWRARITQHVPQKVIGWESVEGLNNRGTVSFQNLSSDESRVSINLQFELPRFMRGIFDNQFVKNFVTEKLETELKVFRSLVLRKRRAKALMSKRVG